MPDYTDLITKHANRVGIDPNQMKTIMRIESGGKAGSRTGSYKGLFQLSDREFTANGGTGSIYDPEQNTMAAANKIARENLQFKQKYGRDPTLTDTYMVHQQGEAGYAAHMARPDAPAWQNMLSTGEGRQKGVAWAKRAIWGNLSDADKAKFGNVENLSSRDFVSTWSGKVGEGGEMAEGERAAGTGTRWHRARGVEPADQPPTPDDLGKKKTVMGEAEFEPIPQPAGWQVSNLVPRIQLARVPE